MFILLGKAQRIKAAKREADSEIQAFKNEKDAQYKAYEAEVSFFLTALFIVFNTVSLIFRISLWSCDGGDNQLKKKTFFSKRLEDEADLLFV